MTYQRIFRGVSGLIGIGLTLGITGCAKSHESSTPIAATPPVNPQSPSPMILSGQSGTAQATQVPASPEGFGDAVQGQPGGYPGSSYDAPTSGYSATANAAPSASVASAPAMTLQRRTDSAARYQPVSQPQPMQPDPAQTY